VKDTLADWTGEPHTLFALVLMPRPEAKDEKGETVLITNSGGPQYEEALFLALQEVIDQWRAQRGH